jgi:DNA-binding MarR family transcriptional regulator
MLLALYSREIPLTVSTLSNVTRLPESTGTRWVAVLESRRLVSRLESPGTPGPDLVSITDEGRNILERSLRAILSAA